MSNRWKMVLAVGLSSTACELVQPPTGDYHARFEDAGGLREGAAVYVAGVRLGRVGPVKLDGEKARVDFTLDKDAGVTVRKDACVAVRWYGSGEAHLRLRPGSESQPALAPGSEITCVENVGARAETAVLKATEVLEDVASGKGTLGRLLRDEKLADKVERFFEKEPPSPPPVAASASAAPSSSAKPPAPRAGVPKKPPPPVPPKNPLTSEEF